MSFKYSIKSLLKETSGIFLVQYIVVAIPQPKINAGKENFVTQLVLFCKIIRLFIGVCRKN